MLVAALNPTPAGSEKEQRNYSYYDVQRFLSKISGPILDRIDIHIHVNPVDINKLTGKETSESSAVIRERVIRAREIQLKRFSGRDGIYSNSGMGTKELREFCVLDNSGEDILKTATVKLGFSARAYDKILKVSRTIADLAGEENISAAHVSEAVQYRSLDRSNWI
jgi:magnesium chelatase family protein